ncbi:MAG TPA: NADH-quinone oxidoreductase subunit N [Fimbriiglobus sp.]
MTNPQLLEPVRTAAAEAYKLVIPEIALVGVACVLFVWAAVSPRKLLSLVLAIIGVGLAAALTLWYADGSTYVDGHRYYSPFDPTGVAAVVRWIALIGAGIFCLVAYGEVTRETAGEYYGCLLVLTAGASLVGRANDLVTLYLSLEMISIPTYVLLYLPVKTRAGQEAAMKYFLLSVLSSAVLLFGFSYLYGLTGSTNLRAVVDVLADAHLSAGTVSPLALVAVVCVVVGIGFKVTAFPFHFYAPDVYQGGPTGVVAVLATVPKVAGFVALARVLGLLVPGGGLPFDAVNTTVPLMLWLLAAASMIFGNVLAILQADLKRMLAYSGVAHSGYILMGLAAAGAGSPGGVAAVIFYLAAYGFMTVGAFAVLAATSTASRPVETVDDLAGLAQDRPWAAGMLAACLVSMIGLPLTAGFVGKFQLFFAAWDAPIGTPMGNLFRALAVIAAVNAAVGAVYYLRAAGAMYLRSPLTPFGAGRSSPALWAAGICVAGTVALGVYPKPLVDAIHAAMTTAVAK